MDSKIIAAIIIAVGFVAGTYIYVSDTPFNRCMKAYAEKEHIYAMEQCLERVKDF